MYKIVYWVAVIAAVLELIMFAGIFFAGGSPPPRSWFVTFMDSFVLLALFGWFMRPERITPKHEGKPE